MGITPEDIQAQRELLERGERILEAQEQQAERERLRDTFAAAALTGFIRGIPDNSVFHLGLIAKQAYEVADAMMRERLQIESAEYTDGISPSTETKSTVTIRREVADLRDTPATHTTPSECSTPREGTSEPVAWLVTGNDPSCEYQYVTLFRESADAAAAEEDGTVAPLYRSPTLTDAEREAVEAAQNHIDGYDGEWGDEIAATLRGLLERLK